MPKRSPSRKTLPKKKTATRAPSKKLPKKSVPKKSPSKTRPPKKGAAKKGAAKKTPPIWEFFKAELDDWGKLEPPAADDIPREIAHIQQLGRDVNIDCGDLLAFTYGGAWHVGFRFFDNAGQGVVIATKDGDIVVNDLASRATLTGTRPGRLSALSDAEHALRSEIISVLSKNGWEEDAATKRRVEGDSATMLFVDMSFADTLAASLVFEERNPALILRASDDLDAFEDGVLYSIPLAAGTLSALLSLIVEYQHRLKGHDPKFGKRLKELAPSVSADRFEDGSMQTLRL